MSRIHHSQIMLNHETLIICKLQIWNNIISINFKDEECTQEWKQTFTVDFEGKYKQVSDTRRRFGNVFG